MTSFRSRRRAAPLWAIVALACGLAALAASAQTPPPATPAAPAPAVTPVTLPKSDCGERPEHPGSLASDRQRRQWRTDANAYLECYKKYAMEQRALAQGYLEAANALIDAYNTAVKEMQAAAEAAGN